MPDKDHKPRNEKPDKDKPVEQQEGRIVPIQIEDEMKTSYLNYAMSVIVGRALPDVRDGLKPVHRRTLYAMRELGLENSRAYKKSARIVGEILGKYHPHGDVAVYDTLVRMAQDFSMRYPLVDGQGNFGCFTGDTKIKLLDGRDLSFEQLAHEFGIDQPFYVYSVNQEGRITVGVARHPRVTRRNEQIIEVTLDSGETIRCTSDHRFMLRDGTYKQVQDIDENDSLMPGYFKTAPVKEGLNDYLMILQPVTGKYEFIHQMADRWSAEKGLAPFPRAGSIKKYFGSFEKMLSQAAHYNHRIISKRLLEERSDVWDITVEEHHNFLLASGVFVHNSVDGDSPAAMRYTEARLASISTHLLSDIDKETVDFAPNFDETLEEPKLLPATLPNLLVNGSSGIAVGMATNIPPHNLNEVVDAVVALVDDPGLSIKEIQKLIKGPDFPTAASIVGAGGIRSAYETGRGIIKLRAKASVEEMKGGREAIIVTEIPYQVNKATLIETIADLVNDKKIEGIADVRDESDREGMRVVIILKRDAPAQVVLNQLYKHTQMQTSFGIILLALADGRPKVMNLKEILEHYVRHRKEVIIRRSRFELEKARDRAHILEGLKVALDNLDAIIKTIRKSANPAEAKEALMENFDLSERQAQAILEMQLQRLTGLEREKIDEEYKQVLKRIEELESILRSERKILDIIKKEILEIKEKHGDDRRTQIVKDDSSLEMNIEDLIADEDVVISISHQGYVKRAPLDSYRKQRRGGVGVIGAVAVSGAGGEEGEETAEDFVEHLFIASTHDFLMLFTSKGKAYAVRVHELPVGTRTSKGKFIKNFVSLNQGEKISSFVPIRQFEPDKYLVMVTAQGVVKKTELSQFENIRKSGIAAVNLQKDDELIAVRLTGGKDNIFVATRLGKAIHFPEKDARPMGRAAAGTRGMKLGKGDIAIGMEVVDKDDSLLTVTEKGFAKRTKAAEYRLQSRGGSGIINLKIAGKNGPAIGMRSVSDQDDLMVMSAKGMVVRIPVKDIRTTGRAAQGVRVIHLKSGDKVAAIAVVEAEEAIAEEAKSSSATA